LKKLLKEGKFEEAKEMTKKILENPVKNSSGKASVVNVNRSFQEA
jgi:hypothetical protein